MKIAVWGNSGSGKSTFAIKLAACIAKSKNVVLIDTNFIAPQLQIWYPRAEVKTECSLSNILDNDIQSDTVARKMYMANDNLGIIGYVKDEITINNVPKRDDTAGELLKAAERIADVVIVDCQTNVTQDVLSFIGVTAADMRILCLTPDLRGAAFYRSNVSMIENTSTAAQLKIYSQLRRYAPIDAIENVIGKGDYYIPYDENVYLAMLQGEIGKVEIGGEYIKTIKKIAAAVGGDLK